MEPTRRVNPYIAGTPVTGTDMFFGREDVFSFVRRNLTGRHRDAPIVLYGQRRTGKTSVLYQMRRHLDARYRCIFTDLHGLNLNGMENLLWGLATSIRRGLERDHQLSVAVPDRAAFSANPHAAFESTFLDAVWSTLGEDHLLLMIDEVVRLHEEARAGRLEREVFDYLRHLMQHFERLNFVFSLGSGVEEMKKDYAFLFGVALYHRISFLEPMAACALITRPAQGCYEVLPDAAEKILQITSGHPYYTQLVCHCLFDRWLQAPKPQMTSADVDAVLTEAIELGSANLTYVWEDSTPEEQAMMAVMAALMPASGPPATVDQIREVWRKVEVQLPAGEAASAARNLIAREVAVATGGAYSFTVDLQRLWLDKHRRLDWVKEELEESAPGWLQEPARKRDRTARDKPPGQQHAPGSRRRAILLTSSGILALIVIIVVIFIGNQHSNSPHARTNNPTPSPTFSFRDDFSNTQAGWSVTGQDASGRYSNGKYQIYLNKADAGYAIATAPNLITPPSSIAIEISARPILGTAADFYYGISCMSDSSDYNEYEFLIQPGYAAIDKYVNGNADRLAFAGSSAVPSNGENHVRAVCATTASQNAVHLMLWVNGEKLADVIDHTDPLLAGEVGLIVTRIVNTKEAVAAEFDSIVVTQI